MVSVAGAPYEIAQPGGMRAMDDPVMMLFCLYSFVLSCAAATVFDFFWVIAHHNTR